jgi:hypothetical protein
MRNIFPIKTPCFILPPYSQKKIFGKFCGIYYVCKNEQTDIEEV